MGPGESITTTIRIQDKITIDIVTFYRPPNEYSLDNLESLLNRNQNYYTIYLGDFNLPDLDWVTNSDTPRVKDTSSRKAMHEKALSIIDNSNLVQLVHESTHNKGNTLDLVLVDSELINEMKISCEVLPKISDHNMLLLKLTTTNLVKNKTNTPNKIRYNFNEANFILIKEEFKTLYEHLSSGNLNAIEMWDLFKRTINECLNEHVPILPFKTNSKSWIDRELIRLIRKRDRVHKRNKTYPTYANLLEEELLNKQVKKEIEQAKSNFLSSYIHEHLKKGNTKPLYNHINQSKGQANQINSLVDTPNSQIANKLAEYFESVYAKDSVTIPEFKTNIPNVMHILKIEEAGVADLLLNLDHRKGGGPDKLSAYILKTFTMHVPLFLKCITLIMQTSVDDQQVPTDWKTAYICPVFKGGNRQIASNYRPISLTSIVSKTLEHVVASEMWKHIDEHNIISSNQHGFRKHYNTTTQLLHVTHNALKARDQRDPYHMISFDFSKAFDKVPHNLLIHKLTEYKFNNNIVAWIKEWLNKRTSIVTVNAQVSSEMNIASGVPQGSVLGPLLFLLYINDISNNIKHSECRLYADDTLICANLNRVNTQQLQEDIKSLENWSQTWCMPFNANKCTHIELGKETPSIELFMHGQKIPQSNRLKYLGLTITWNTKWTEHISNITKKANKTLGMLRRCLKGAPEKLKIISFNTVVRPILEYASPLWSPCNLSQIKIYKKQRQAIGGHSEFQKQLVYQKQCLKKPSQN